MDELAWLRRIDRASHGALGSAPESLSTPLPTAAPIRSASRRELMLPRGALPRRARDGQVVLWTVMSDDAFAVLQRDGAVSGRPEFMEPYSAAYGWVRWQMMRRLPNYRGQFPVWAWRNPKRWELLEILDGAIGVLVTHVAPEESMVCSREGLFTSVLNGAPLPPDGFSDDALDEFFDRWDEVLIDADCGQFPWWQYPVSVLRELLSTWEEIIVEDADSAGLVQACVPLLQAADVIDAVALTGMG